MRTMIRLLQFGSPAIQKQYKELCESSKISFEEFQLKLIEDTGCSYDDLKKYWISGTEAELNDEEYEDLFMTIIDNYLIIHFDPEKKSILGMVSSDHLCFIGKQDFLYDEVY